MSNLKQTVAPSHVVRLTGYRWRDVSPPSGNAIELFVSQWKSNAEQDTLNGLIYRDLCLQMPEWTAAASAEIDHLLEFTFLEYTVALPETEFPECKEVSLEGFERVEGMYSVDFRLTNDVNEGVVEAVMFNLFEQHGPPAMQQGFLMNWVPRGQFKIGEPGMQLSLLHERLLPHARFAAFNRVEVSRVEDYIEGIPRFEAAFPRSERKAPGGIDTKGSIPAVVSHLGLFRIVASVAARPASSESQTMMAVRAHGYGPPEVLRYEQVPRPTAGPGQILVRVKAVSINPLDVKMRSGEVGHIYPSWFPDVYGYSVSGIVEALGEGATERHVGEEVYGINNPIRRGGYAEYVVGPESFFYPKPQTMDWAAAAAAPSIFATAHGALFGRAQLKAGQRILIHGGSGVIGGCAVQLAKQAGAFVLSTASTGNVEALRSLGADVAIDYKTSRFEDVAKDLDMVLDTVGGETRERSWELLKAGGILASLLPPPPDEARAKKLGVQAFMVHGHPSIGEIMPEMTRRLSRGELQKPEIAAVFGLADAAEAHAAFENSPPRGRIVLRVADSPGL